MTLNTQTKGKRDGLAEYEGPPNMIQYQFRIPLELKKALETEALRLTDKLGVPVSTSGVMRKLLAEGLQRSKAAR